jgi:hypothetical protein
MKKRRAIDPTRMGFGTPTHTGWLGWNPELSGISQGSASGPTTQEFLSTRPTMPNLSGEPVATSQVIGKPPGGHHQGMPDMTKSGGGANQTKEMLEALGELTFDDPTPSNLGKPGGTGGGGFKLFPNSMVENRTPIGPFDEDEQRKRWWAMYGKIA